MGQTANIFGAASLRRSPIPIAVPRLHPGTVAPARLIPGAANLISAPSKKSSQSVMQDGSWASISQTSPLVGSRIAVRLLPEFCKQFRPGALGSALLDVVLISLGFFLETALLRATGLAFTVTGGLSSTL